MERAPSGHNLSEGGFALVVFCNSVVAEMTSLGPWLGGRSVFDPFTMTDAWDPWDFGWGSLWDTGSNRRRGGGAAGQDETTALARTNVDWKETGNAHVFTAELPGARKEDVKVEVEDGNVLRISGDKVKEEEQTGDTWHRMERRRGRFVRRFRLPENANLDEVKCNMEHGLLRIEVPKKETTSQRQNVRSIDIS